MPTLRKGAGSSRPAAHSGQPGLLLDNESPYGSRRVLVEYDGAATAAYLHDADAIVGAAWIANHQQAPVSTDLSRLNAGRAPLMPAGHTKHPGGRPPLDASTLRALWFEEGDGVAIIEGGQLLAVPARALQQQLWRRGCALRRDRRLQRRCRPGQARKLRGVL